MVYLAGLAMAARTYTKYKRWLPCSSTFFSFALLFCADLLSSLVFSWIGFLCFFYVDPVTRSQNNTPWFWSGFSLTLVWFQSSISLKQPCF